MRGRAGGVLIVAVLSVAACGAQGRSPELDTPEARGERLFSRHCSSCHSTAPDSVIVGPSLAGVADRAGERVDGMDAGTYLETSILSPGEYVVDGFRDVMPKSFAETLTENDLQALIAYLTTLN